MRYALEGKVCSIHLFYEFFLTCFMNFYGSFSFWLTKFCRRSSFYELSWLEIWIFAVVFTNFYCVIYHEFFLVKKTAQIYEFCSSIDYEFLWSNIQFFLGVQLGDFCCGSKYEKVASREKLLPKSFFRMYLLLSEMCAFRSSFGSRFSWRCEALWTS